MFAIKLIGIKNKQCSNLLSISDIFENTKDLIQFSLTKGLKPEIKVIFIILDGNTIGFGADSKKFL